MTASRSPAETIRPALVPGMIAGAALLSGIALMGIDWYLIIRFLVSILGLIIAWFAFQGGQWWWTIVFFVIAVVWNPVAPVPIEGPGWVIAHIVAAAVFAAGGALIRVPRPDAPPERGSRARSRR